MIKSTQDYEISDVFKKDASFRYVVPKYQREYTWKHDEWKDLYDDLMENDFGYFIGSIICVDNGDDAYAVHPLELIDGQQRLTTLCLLMAAIYNKMSTFKDELDEDDLDEYTSLRKSIINKESPNGLMLEPQIQNYNQADFYYIMGQNGFINWDKKEKKYAFRKIAKCYKYFLQRIENDLEESDNQIDRLLEIKKKVFKAIIVKIEVNSHAAAYTLFESLNNRGTPLTSVDLMKNMILARSERAGLSYDDCFNEWQKLLDNLGDDYKTQERFFRHYYNAFKNELNEPFKSDDSRKKDPLGTVATRSNLLRIYEALITRDLAKFMEDIVKCSYIYAQLLYEEKMPTHIKKQIVTLNHIEGVPSYQLLLFLLRKREELQLKDVDFKKIVLLLTKFFVRRNTTDVPGTRDLNRIFMSIISEIEEKELKGALIYPLIEESLIKNAASDELFEARLKGDLYDENVGVARFVLCALAEKYMTQEKWVDLWERNIYSDNSKTYKWTIEHIFPEGKNIPETWVDMIANGDRELANEYLDKYVHKIGNLTITGYNSTLGNMSFEEKRDRKNRDGLYVGYKNGLELNANIAVKDKWTIKDIEERTNDLVSELINMYKLSE